MWGGLSEIKLEFLFKELFFLRWVWLHPELLSLTAFMYESNVFPGCDIVMPNLLLIMVTKLAESRAPAVCIQGANRDGFLDAF